MDISSKKLKFGFVNLTLDFLVAEDLIKATNYAENAKNFLQNEMNINIVESAKSVNNRNLAKISWKLFKAENVDAVIIYNGTFNTGEITTEIVRNLDVPYLIWGIEEFAINEHRFTGSLVGVLPQGYILTNIGRKFSFVYGSDVSKQETRNKIRIFINAVSAISYLKEATIGVIGMRPDGFEISDFDELAIKNKFGTTITKISMYTFANIIKSITDKEIDEDMKIQQEIFCINKKNIEESKGLSKIYLATKKVANDKNLQSYAVDCWPELRDQDNTPICPANGRMNTEGVMASCECDVNGSLTLMMQYSMTKSTPWLADLVNYISIKDALLFWHCGNSPFNLSNEKPKIQKPSVGGLTEVTSLREGVVTVCRLNSIRGKYTLHVGLGNAIENDQYLNGSNMTVKMKGGNMQFIESLLLNGIPHHNGIVYGDIIAEIKEFANLMDIPVVVVS